MARFEFQRWPGRPGFALLRLWPGGNCKDATQLPPGRATRTTLRLMLAFIAANREDGIDPPTVEVLLGLYKSRKVRNRIRKKLLRMAAAELLGG